MTSRIRARRPLSYHPSLFYRCPPPRARTDRVVTDKLLVPRTVARCTRQCTVHHTHYPIGDRAYVPNRASCLCTLCFYYFYIYYYYLYWFFHTHKHTYISHRARAHTPVRHTLLHSPTCFLLFSFILDSYTDYN